MRLLVEGECPPTSLLSYCMHLSTSGPRGGRSDQGFTISTAERYHLSQCGVIFCGLGGQGRGNLLYKARTEGYRCLSPWPSESGLTSWRPICPHGEMKSFLGPGSARGETVPEWP